MPQKSPVPSKKGEGGIVRAGAQIVRVDNLLDWK